MQKLAMANDCRNFVHRNLLWKPIDLRNQLDYTIATFKAENALVRFSGESCSGQHQLLKKFA
jgi:hypothetical protein